MSEYEPFVEDGKILKTCADCNEDRPLDAFVVEEGETLSSVCCFCEGGHEDPRGLDLEKVPYGRRLGDGFRMMGGDE